MTQKPTPAGPTAGVPAMVRVGEQPRPRMLIIGFDQEPGTIDRLRRLAPTVKVVEHPRDVNQHEYDILVTDRFKSPWASRLAELGEHGLRMAEHLSVVYRSDGEDLRQFEGVRQRSGAVAGELDCVFRRIRTGVPVDPGHAFRLIPDGWVRVAW